MRIGYWIQIAVSVFLFSFGSIHPGEATIFFEDNFDGTALDSSKWNIDDATTGKRWCSSTVSNHHSSPGNWQDVSTEPCNGFTQSYPYGFINVANGEVSFISDYKRTFPYIWAGPPSRPSPFPASGDFTLEIRMKYDVLMGNGDGLQSLSWNDSSPVGNNPPGAPGLFGIWGGWNGVYTNYYDVPAPYAYHVYTTEYTGGIYKYYLDGVLEAGPFVSSFRPNMIWIGNPVFTHWTNSDWTDFTIDYIRVLVPNNPPVCALHDIVLPCSGPDGTIFVPEPPLCSDPDGDVLTYTWEGPFGTVTGIRPALKLPLGTSTVTLTVDDGNGGTASDTVSITVQDTIPPATTVSLNGTQGTNGWFISDVTATLTSTDNCSGCNNINYVLNGAGYTVPGSSATVMITGNGTNDLRFHATDKAGNVEQTKTVQVKIDKNAPSISANATPAPNANGWNNTDVTVTFNCSDSVSGVASCSSPVTVTTEGAGQEVCGTAVDNAGNTAQTCMTLNIDKTPPDPYIVMPGLLWPPNHKMVLVKPAINTSDNLSGNVKTELVSVTSNEPDNGLGDGDTAGDIVINSNGTIYLRAERSGSGNGRIYTLTYAVTDLAGNVAIASATVNVPHNR